MRPSLYTNIYRLHETLHDLEAEAGLLALPDHERRVVLAIVGASALTGETSTKRLMSHRLLGDMSRPSLFRALNKLLDRGLIEQPDGKKGSYRLVHLGAPSSPQKEEELESSSPNLSKSLGNNRD